jgi:hypothetical protein
MELENIILLVILCVLILYTITHIKVNPQPPPPPVVGGCAGTRYGCCSDNMTPKRDMNGSNCYPLNPYPPNPYPYPPLPPPPSPYPQPVVGGCAGTRYGCCPNNVDAKYDNMGSNCSSYPRPPPPPPNPNPNPSNNACPSSQQGGNCTDNPNSCEKLFGGKLYPDYSGCSTGSSCCITPK